MRVLVADDDRGSLEVVSSLLSRWGFDVVTSRNGEDAWRLVQAMPAPRLAILDWVMPGLDGVALCRRIRAEPALAGAHLLMLTSRETRDDLIEAFDAGADDYLTKPVDPAELRARINVAARVIALQQKLASRVAELEAALAQVKQLQGLVPICSYCKRIRNDHDYWEQVEHYITSHTELQFSHGICPACYKRVLEELDPPRSCASDTRA